MKILKLILAQFVDLAIGIIALIMFVIYLINDSNFSGFLIIVAGYVSFNIINKVRFNINPQARVDQINEIKKQRDGR